MENENTTEKLTGAWNNVQKEAGSVLENLNVDELKAMSTRAADEAAGFVRKHPLACLAGGIAVGFALGFFVGRESGDRK
jgi:ElaB/YqjD/DUF883 family membrane-anchored ribosome-binding protein